jgi:hypothetical protein
MCRVPESTPQPASSGAEAGDSGTGLSQFLTRILDQLSPSSWMPAIVVVANLALILQLHSQRNLDVGQAVLSLTKAPVGLLIVLVLAIVVTSIVTQAFASSVIRFLEGYWGSVRPLNFWSTVRTRRHVRHVKRLTDRYDALTRISTQQVRRKVGSAELVVDGAVA